MVGRSLGGAEQGSRRARDCAPHLRSSSNAYQIWSLNVNDWRRAVNQIRSTMHRIQIRLARSKDLNALAEMRYRFRAETGLPTEARSQFVRRCASWMRKRFRVGSSAWRCWVVDDGDQLLGHVCVHLFEKMPNPVNEREVHAYLTNFYVVPEMRSRGFGRRLLNEALSWCRAQGTDAVILWAAPGSKSLYRRCGFVEPADIFEFRGDALRGSN